MNQAFQNNRHSMMITADGTWYPTAVTVGQRGIVPPFTIKGQADTVDVDPLDSVFFTGGASGIRIPGSYSIIRRIVRMGTAGTLQFQDHDGTGSIVPLITFAARGFDDYDIQIIGPWRIISGAAAIAIVVFDLFLGTKPRV